MAKLCILLLCGLPGAGKSTLCKKIYDIFRRKRYAVVGCELKPDIVTHESEGVQNDQDNLCYHVCFDSIFSIAEMLQPQDLNNTLWKVYRQHICKLVEIMIGQITGTQVSDKLIKDIPVGVQSNFNRSVYQLHPHVMPVASEKRNILVMIDDNMYYRSMRYEYYKIARTLNVGFMEIFIDCPVNIALQQNFLRPKEQNVPSNVITNMAEKIEPPSDLVPWEKNLYLTIKVKDLTCNLILKTILKKIEESWNNPVFKAVESDDPQVTEQSRMQCSKNLIHQCDQILRQVIGKFMKTLPKMNDKEEIQLKAKTCSKLKAEILNDIGQGNISIDLDEDEIKNSCKESTSKLYVKIEKLFLEYFSNC